MSTMKKGACPHCQSGEIMPNADTAERDTLSIQVYEENGVRSKGRRTFPIRAWVCTRCGYTEFYVERPQELARSYRRSVLSFA